MASGFSPVERDTLVQNTGCRFIGGRDRRVVADMLTNGREFADALPQIEPRQFWAEWAGDGPHLLNVRSDLTKERQTVSDAEWTAYLDEITGLAGGYYRPAMPPVAPIPPEANPAPAEPAGEVVPAAPAARKERAKPAAVTVKPRGSRATKATKPSGKKAKPPDVTPSGRTLDD